MNNEKINSKIKLSNNSSFVILIFVILKYWSFYISSFQILTPTLCMQFRFYRVFNF